MKTTAVRNRSEQKRSADAPDFHVTWEAPVLDLSGYASSSRAALAGLQRAGVRLRLIPLNTGRNTDQGESIDRGT